MELSQFRIARRTEGEIQVVAPSGRITLGQSVRELRQAFDELAEQSQRVVVNMAEVPYIDSAGLGSLVSGLSAVKKSGGALALCDVQPRVAQLLELTGLTGVLPNFPSEGEALQFLATAA